MERRILHVDFNGFYASVECMLNPDLAKFPLAVAGDPQKRHGIILAKNEAAKRCGVKTAEPIWQARQKCPKLITVAPHFDEYVRISERAREILDGYSMRVEPFGLDESWVDLTARTNNFQEAEQLANEIRIIIKRELKITVSVGVSFNKVFAKLGSDMKKPDAVTVIAPWNYKRLVWPLPASDLLFVGRATERKLERLGITTIGGIAQSRPEVLVSKLGKWGLKLHAFANGRDDAPVLYSGTKIPPKSVGNGVTTPFDLCNDEQVRLTLSMLCESVAARLREQGLRACTISIAVRDVGLFSFVRQKKLSEPSCLAGELLDAAMELFIKNYRWQIPVRSISVTASDFWDGSRPVQLELMTPEERRMRKERLEFAVDGIRARFGHHSILRCGLLRDRRIGDMNPKAEHTIFPVGYRT
ncbi:MAG: DNA polymerase IV [Clostridia bacterium]|nr:DNA polymerase IV [Clostridia bacterium]